jgi:hypothetical protein
VNSPTEAEDVRTAGPPDCKVARNFVSASAHITRRIGTVLKKAQNRLAPVAYVTLGFPEPPRLGRDVRVEPAGYHHQHDHRSEHNPEV